MRGTAPGILGLLGKVVAAIYVGIFLHIIIVYVGIPRPSASRPAEFLAGAKDAMITAFATRSGSGSPAGICEGCKGRTPRHTPLDLLLHPPAGGHH